MGVSLAEKQAMLSTVGVQNRTALSVHALAHSTSYRTIEIVLFGNVETFDDGPPRSARADAIPYSFNEPEGHRLTLFVGAGEDRTKLHNLIV